MTLVNAKGNEKIIMIAFRPEFFYVSNIKDDIDSKVNSLETRLELYWAILKLTSQLDYLPRILLLYKYRGF